MDTDPHVLLALIAVRTLGGRAVPIKQDVFKGLQKPLKAAQEQGLLAQRKAEVLTTNAAGKVSKKKVDVLDLTEHGEAHLRHAANPEALAASEARQKAALLQSLEADRQTLREQVMAALSATGKKAIDPSKAIKDLSTTVEQLADRLAKLETALESRGDDAILARIDEAFASLRQKLGASGSTAQRPSPPAPTHPHPAPTATQDSLTDVLRGAYRTLRQFHEYNDGLVPIPRLYHEARRHLPSLSVEALHRELMALWERRALELKILNEVRLATEPDKAIQRGDNLYYFVYWQSP